VYAGFKWLRIGSNGEWNCIAMKRLVPQKADKFFINFSRTVFHGAALNNAGNFHDI
jgi:hypothetical protein